MTVILRRYKATDGVVSMTPIYNYLIDGDYGLNILVYSGDDDSVCGTVGTQDWIWDLGYEIDGRMWETYTGITFLCYFLCPLCVCIV